MSKIEGQLDIYEVLELIDEDKKMYHFVDEIRPEFALCGYRFTSGNPFLPTNSLDEIGCVVCVDMWENQA